MGQPASTPYRVERIKDLDGPLRGGYVLKEASGVIVAAFPGGTSGPLARCEGTARLAAAGANHLPALLERAGRLEAALRALREAAALHGDATLYEAAATLTLFLDAADRARRDTPD